jgi:ferredoxin, 2Fe-2S
MLKVTYVQPDGSRTTLEVRYGQSVMEAAQRAGVPGIVAECGGSCSCATCHIHVEEEWFARLAPPTSIETELLEFAPDVRATSRLACQIILAPELDGLTIFTPAAGNNR